MPLFWISGDNTQKIPYVPVTLDFMTEFVRSKSSLALSTPYGRELDLVVI